MTRICLFIIAAAVLSALGWWLLRRRAWHQQRSQLVAAAGAIGGWIEQAEKSASACLVPVTQAVAAEAVLPAQAYGELERVLVTAQPAFERDAGWFGPAVVGCVLRLRLCSDAFRAAVGQPANPPLAREMVRQLKLAAGDLQRHLHRRPERRRQ